jgi:hypothetical protein
VVPFKDTDIRPKKFMPTNKKLVSFGANSKWSKNQMTQQKDRANSTMVNEL